MINLLILSNLQNSIYEDFANSVKSQLAKIGISSVISRNIYTTDAVNIVWGIGSPGFTNYEELGRTLSRENCFLFNVEQISSKSPLITEEYIEYISNYTIFDYNENNCVALQKKKPHAKSFEFPIIPDHNTITNHGHPCWTVNDWISTDILFYGALNPRRIKIINEIKDMGLTVKIIDSSTRGKLLSEEILKSKFILNIHYYESAIFEVERIMRPVGLGVPVISEASKMPSKVKWENSGIIFSEYSKIPETINNIMRDTTTQISLSRKNAQFNLSLNTSDSIKKIVNEVIYQKSAQTKMPT